MRHLALLTTLTLTQMLASYKYDIAFFFHRRETRPLYRRSCGRIQRQDRQTAPVFNPFKYRDDSNQILPLGVLAYLMTSQHEQAKSRPQSETAIHVRQKDR